MTGRIHYVCIHQVSFFTHPKEIAMTEPTTLTHSPSDVLNPGLAVLRPLLGAAALGLVVLYGVAFAESPLAHNAAHDVRHITVKPCH
jgi:cobalt transporter subunit CbtB